MTYIGYTLQCYILRNLLHIQTYLLFIFLCILYNFIQNIVENTVKLLHGTNTIQSLSNISFILIVTCTPYHISLKQMEINNILNFPCWTDTAHRTSISVNK